MEDEVLGPREVAVELDEQAARHRAEMQRHLDEAYNQRDVAKLIELSPEFMALYKPELFTQVFGDRQATNELRLEALVEMAKMGVISPSALSDGGDDLTGVLLRMLGGQASTGGRALPAGANSAALLESVPESSQTAGGAEQVRSEYAALKSAGYDVTAKRLQDDAYAIEVALQDGQGHTLDIYIVCTQRYPKQPPQVFVELDGKQERFQSAILRNWTADSTVVDLIDEIMRFYS